MDGVRFERRPTLDVGALGALFEAAWATREVLRTSACTGVRRSRLVVPLFLVTGVPGSRKSTLSAALAATLDLPLIAKDRFKEILFDTLGARDLAWSQQLGAAAIALQYETMCAVKHAVVDSALWTGRSEPELIRLGLPMVQVYCDCPFDLARRRFFDRLAAGTRHKGFCEEEMSERDFERFRPLSEPLELPFPLVRVDTTAPVDSRELARVLRSAQSSRRTTP